MKILFFICLALLVADIIGISALSSSISKLKQEIRNARRKKKQKGVTHKPEETEPAEKPAQAPAEKATGNGGAPVAATTATAMLDSEPTPPTGIVAGGVPSTGDMDPEAAPASVQAPLTVGKAHNIGRRHYQQDSLGSTRLDQFDGLLAVVADGMGGLSGGDEVSQRIVMDALEMSTTFQMKDFHTILPNMLTSINQDVNKMLGPDMLYKSGSTLTAVLATEKCFHWITVGDSRIYLYREGYINQLNTDHDLMQDWMPEILEGERSYEESVRDNEGKKLTSFIGMGNLRHIDRSLTPISTEPGDRVLLMSDGVYNAISTKQMANILKQYPDVNTAAAMFERAVLAARIPTQDNFTVEIIAF